MKRTERPGVTTVSISVASKVRVEQLVGGVISDAVPRADGRFDVQVEDDVLASLLRIDADIDKAIERLYRQRR